MKRCLSFLGLVTTLSACVGIPTPGGPEPMSFTPSRPLGVLAPPPRPVAQTDGYPLPVALPEAVGDRVVVEPIERSERVAEGFAWCRLAWDLGFFDPIIDFLVPERPRTPSSHPGTPLVW